MAWRSLVLVGIMLCAWPAAHASAAPSAESLTPKERQTLDAVGTSWFRGDQHTAVTRLAALVERLDDDRRTSIDAILSSKRLPSLTQMLTESRLSVLQQGGKIPKLQVHEALIVLPALEQHINEALEAASKSRVIGDPLSPTASLDEYDDLLWESHVLANRLAGAKSIADRVSHLIHVSPREAERLTDQQRELVNRDYQALSKRIEQVAADLAEHETVLRINRLSLATNILEQPDLSRERMFAAYYWQVDVGRIEAFLEASRRRQRKETQFSLAELNDSHLRQRVAQSGKKAQHLAGQLAPKAAWLFDGIFWWHRGRYGTGTAVFGLAKSEEAATVPAAQFALYMPPDRELDPSDPTKVLRFDESTPRYDRRHHYWWAWEDRRLAVGPSGAGTGGTALAGVQPFY